MLEARLHAAEMIKQRSLFIAAANIQYSSIIKINLNENLKAWHWKEKQVSTFRNHSLLGTINIKNHILNLGLEARLHAAEMIKQEEEKTWAYRYIILNKTIIYFYDDMLIMNPFFMAQKMIKQTPDFCKHNYFHLSTHSLCQQDNIFKNFINHSLLDTINIKNHVYKYDFHKKGARCYLREELV
ncbi:hypothetical protein ACJX0J_019068 [Zea mays]